MELSTSIIIDDITTCKHYLPHSIQRQNVLYITGTHAMHLCPSLCFFPFHVVQASMDPPTRVKCTSDLAFSLSSLLSVSFNVQQCGGWNDKYSVLGCFVSRGEDSLTKQQELSFQTALVLLKADIYEYLRL
jgi:hypothetical protein